MTPQPDPSPPSPSGPVAYLVVREGGRWRDVFRLAPGQVTTIGRAPTNRVVVPDEICSRNHCEVFVSGARWTLRDLGSRNGTFVEEEEVERDWPLEEGQIVRIGTTLLGFTYDISQPLPEVPEPEAAPGDADTAFEVIYDDEPHESEPAIVHRKRESRYRQPQQAGRDRTSRELANLYRLAMEMGSVRDPRELATVVLQGLFSGTVANIGAILLLSDDEDEPRPEKLVVVAYDTKTDLPYQRVSDHLSRAVFERGEAILARDVSDDSRLAGRDSLGQIHAQSVICAPIRQGERIRGLVHLYSTNPDNPLDPDDLEFTLAVADQMGIAVENLREKATLQDGLARIRDENRTLRRQLEIDNDIVGESAAIRGLKEDIARVAPTDANVLIRGESGVGKELVARAVHFGSHRSEGPFTCLNCAALSETLLESELFGHEKGSFTGATERKIGKFEQAHRGSLFLDEVGEMSQAIQAKFLRVLEGHPFERVGGRTPVHVDVRVVAATNRDLEQAVEDSTFRHDLYFRLHVVEIVVPPLRERVEDVPLLANFFLDRFARKAGRPIAGFERSAIDALVAYDWPGNVRQLQNVVERAYVLCRGDRVGAEDLQLSSLQRDGRRGGREAEPVDEFREVSLQELEQEHVLATLERTGWNKSRAAQILGIERSTLDRKLKRYRVSRPSP